MVLYLNAQSIVNKVNELSCNAGELEPDVICVTESWCNKDIPDAFLEINGYELQPDLRKDRTDTEKGRGGGLLVYTKRGLQILKLDSTADFVQHCKFLVKGVVFYLLYRSPNSSNEEVTRLADLIRQAERDSIILGDFNLPQIDWERGLAAGVSGEVLEALEDSHMTQMVEFSTQVRGNILDLVVTNMPERVSEVREEGRLGKSDHVMIVVEIHVASKQRVTHTPQRDWRKAEWNTMRERLTDRCWVNGVRRMDTTAAWLEVKRKVNQLVEDYVPLRRLRNNNRPIWMRQEILRAIRKKKKLWKRDKFKEDQTEYKEQEKKTRNLIRRAKRKFEKNLSEGNNGNNRPFFAYIKQRTKSKPSIGPLKKDGVTVSGDEQMAELLNKTFSDVFTREDKTTIPRPAGMVMEDVVSNVRISEGAVRK